ncbi:serine/threonine-protein kinase [Mariniblastus fucicola]|uniref:non-specific serine/threonine protein kinase n=1 Tax=Mariniblastus fucicola TaxID=980251 RepID=A0A5B9PAM7_9BACT|nr:serine/threonine-protein kinase [Mariniblastus fucicola]QEG22539.1 Serine/threonine-protein kinase PrkC [Mariniblastus fucicola]
MSQSKPHCDREQLAKAISQTLDDAAELKLAEHLCECASCRDELARSAGDESFWNKATANLAASATFKTDTESELHSSVFVKVDPDASDMATIGSAGSLNEEAEASLPFDPPTHPEMLGRVDGFSIEQMIGRGGMGVVYKGFDAELNRPVAIKFLAPHLSVSGVARKRFAREAQAAAAVVHPNVVPIYSIGTSQSRPYLVMALVSGRSLQKHVEEHGPMPAEDVVRIAQQIAAGLAAAHEQGLVHRDIKPANIMLEKEVSRVLITDFGLARAADDAGMTQSGWLAGTPHYMSPEQSKGDDIDHRSDLFSLGSVMYFMATGREPFRAENPYGVLQKIGAEEPKSTRSINGSIPKTLDNVITKLLSKDPSERFASATSVQEVLTQYLAYLQNPTQHSLPKVSVAAKFPWRLKATLGIAALLLAIVAAFQFDQLFYPTTPANTHVGEPVRRESSAFPLPAESTPEWISEVPDSRRWEAELASIRETITRMEQPIRSSTVRAFDQFEVEKRLLDERIRAMERSAGN